MYYPAAKNIIETDDLDTLRGMHVYQVGEDGEWRITLTFKLNDRKIPDDGKQPDTLYLTEGVNPRWMKESPAQ